MFEDLFFTIDLTNERRGDTFDGEFKPLNEEIA